MPDARHPNDSVSESISSYELVGCGPISHPNISSRNASLLRVYPSPSHLRLYFYISTRRVCVCVFTKGNPHGDGVKTVTGARVFRLGPRRNKKRSSRKQVTAEHHLVNYHHLLRFLLSLSVVSSNYASITCRRPDCRTKGRKCSLGDVE